jgi:hypothetical protein
MNESEKSLKSKLKTTFIYFIGMLLFFETIDYLAEQPIFNLFSIENIIVNDFSLNDLHYKNAYKDREINPSLSGRVVLVNSGSLDKDSFRLQLAKTTVILQTFQPSVIGIDHTFSGEKKLGTDSLTQVFKNSKNIILSINDLESQPLKFGLDNSNFGSTNLIDQVSIRRYDSDFSTFAYKIANKLNKNKLKPLDSPSFFINYLAKSEDFFEVGTDDSRFYLKDHLSKQNKFLQLDAHKILLKDSQTMEMLQVVGKNKAFLIGHLGNTKIFDIHNDREDRLRVPCDIELSQRKENMFGLQIHANAIENILNPNKRFNAWTDSIYCSIIKYILIFLFLFYLMYYSMGKIVNVILLTISTLTLLYIVLWFMTKNIYLEIGLTLLEIMILEDVIEFFDSLQDYLIKIKELWKRKA